MTAGLPAAPAIGGSSALQLVHRVLRRAGAPSECTGCRRRDRRAAPRRCAVQSVRSRSTCAVTSTGLSSDANGGSACFSASSVAGAEPRHVEAERVAEIEREALDRARIGDDAGPFHRRLEAREQLRDVDQLFHRFDHIHGGVAQQRGHDRVVARERAGVRAGRSPRALAAPGDAATTIGLADRAGAPRQLRGTVAACGSARRTAQRPLFPRRRRARSGSLRRRGRLRSRSRCSNEMPSPLARNAMRMIGGHRAALRHHADLRRARSRRDARR